MSEPRDPSPSPRAAPPATPRRRRWRRRAWIAVGIVALLAGAGAGWFGSGDDGTTAGAGPPDAAGPAAQGERGSRRDGDVASNDGGVVAGGPTNPNDPGPAPAGGAASVAESAATAALAGNPPGGPGAEPSGEPSGEPSAEPSAEPVAEPGSQSGAEPVLAGGTPSPGPDSNGAPANGVPGIGRPGAGAAPVGAAPGSEFDPDRFASLLALAANRMTTDRFAAAESCLHDLAGFALSEPQQAVVLQANVALRQRMRTVCDEVFAAAQNGDVLAAARRIEDAWRDGAGQFRAAVNTRFAALGVAPLADPGDSAVDLTAVPTPKPLTGNREVRAGVGDERLLGRVADAGARRVTLRIATDRGLRFPTVALVDCEPVTATPAEAADLGFAALHAGRPLLARLWLLAAQAAAAGAPGRADKASTERAARLAELLR